MTAKIIGLLNQKGGVGKTTLGIHLAEAFSLRGQRVLMVDADTQGSALNWAENRTLKSKFPVIGLPKAILHRDLPAMVQDYDVVIVDGPPRSYEVIRSAIMACELIIVPVQPSPLDVWSAKEIANLIREASVFKKDLKYAFVINRKIVNTAIGRDVIDAFKDFDIPVLNSVVCQRIAFAESAIEGLTVFDTHPNSLAAQEIEKLVEKIEEIMKDD